MGTQAKNVDLFAEINGWLHSIGADGRYNRDRIFASLGIPPGPDGDYGQRFGLNDQQRKQVQAAVEYELGFRFPGGIEIDPAGNMNEDEGVSKWAKDWRTYAIIGGAIATPFVIGAIAGAGGSSAAAATTTGAAGVLPSSTIPLVSQVGHLAVPAAITSQGASAAVYASSLAAAAAPAVASSIGPTVSSASTPTLAKTLSQVGGLVQKLFQPSSQPMGAVYTGAVDAGVIPIAPYGTSFSANHWLMAGLALLAVVAIARN